MNARGMAAIMLLVSVMKGQTVARSQAPLPTALATIIANRVDRQSQVAYSRKIGNKQVAYDAKIAVKREADEAEMEESMLDHESDMTSRGGGTSISLGGTVFTAGTALDTTKPTCINGIQTTSTSIGTSSLADLSNVSVSVNFDAIFGVLKPLFVAAFLLSAIVGGIALCAAIIAAIKSKKHEDTTGFSSSGYDSGSYGDSSSGSSDMYSSADSSYTAYRALEKAILKYQ